MSWAPIIHFFKPLKAQLKLLPVLLFLAMVPGPVSANKCEQVHLNSPTTFAQSLPVSSYTLLVGEKAFLLGKEVVAGKVLLFQPLEGNASQFLSHKGPLELYRTEIDPINKPMFDLLGFKEDMFPGYGKFFSEIPNAILFNSLKNKYNARVPEDLQIHVGFYAAKIVSAHQTEIIKNWVQDANVTMGDPAFGSVAGLKPDQLAAPVVNGREKQSTYRHDTEHFASVILIPKKVTEVNRVVGGFWLKAMELMYQLEKQGKLPADFRRSSEYRSILDASYLYVRRFHSLTHVLGMLVRGGGSIDVNTHVVKDFGESAYTETPTVHWPGLGFKPNWLTSEKLPAQNRLFILGLETSVVKETPVTIADAYSSVTNEAVQQALTFADGHATAYPNSLLAKSLQSLIKESGIETLPLLTTQQLSGLQALTMQRYHQMGRVFP